MKILIKAQAGSHLFGTNTPSSDKDYKGVYLPESKDIILGRVKKSVNQSTNKTSEKNTSEDIDTEFYSFDKFMKMLQEGQTVALELLFTPEEFIVEKHPYWDEIVSYRKDLVHKRVTSFIGYAKTQADKYGIKGSRMNCVKAAAQILETTEAEKLFEIWEELEGFTKVEEHSSIMHLPADKKQQDKLIAHWEICGRKFDRTCRVDYVLNILEQIYDNYGERAKQAARNDGVDWKAVSHAIRVCHQGIELLEKGHITLPLEKNARNIIRQVKKGQLDFQTIVQPLVEEMLDKLKKAENNSKLRKELDPDFVDNFILITYRKIIEGKL